MCGGGVSSNAAVFVRCQPPLPLHRGPSSRLPWPSRVSLRNHAGASSEGAALSTAASTVADPVMYATNLLCQICVILPPPYELPWSTRTSTQIHDGFCTEESTHYTLNRDVWHYLGQTILYYHPLGHFSVTFTPDHSDSLQFHCRITLVVNFKLQLWRLTYWSNFMLSPFMPLFRQFWRGFTFHNGLGVDTFWSDCILTTATPPSSPPDRCDECERLEQPRPVGISSAPRHHPWRSTNRAAIRRLWSTHDSPCGHRQLFGTLSDHWIV